MKETQEKKMMSVILQTPFSCTLNWAASLVKPAKSILTCLSELETLSTELSTNLCISIGIMWLSSVKEELLVVPSIAEVASHYFRLHHIPLEVTNLIILIVTCITNFKNGFPKHLDEGGGRDWETRLHEVRHCCEGDPEKTAEEGEITHFFLVPPSYFQLWWNRRERLWL